MIITTTSTLENYEIQKYYGVVSDRVVVGEGLFAEFFAGLKDVFGGRSKRIEESLGDLQAHVLNSMIKKAKKMKANAIIGIKYDIDEISGKNMSMFVINVIGTAVYCKRIEKGVAENPDTDRKNASDVLCFSEKVAETMDSYKIGDTLELLSKESRVSQDNFKELVNDLFLNGMYFNRDVYSIIEIVFKNNYSRLSETNSKSVISEYLSECDSDLVSELLIKNLLIIITEGKTVKYKSLIYELCESISNINISSIEDLIKGVNILKEYDLISAFFAHYKYKYSYDDLLALRRISKYIDSSVFRKIKLSDEFIDGTHWACKRCGENNKISHTTCKCGANKQGYKPDELKILKMKTFIDRLTQAIEE
jgi:uncharacterized protein YbjQ (UPF0145 family)